MRILATEKQVQDSIAAVAAGTAKKADHDRVKDRTRVAGASGNQAKKAQEDAAKKKDSKSWGW